MELLLVPATIVIVAGGIALSRMSQRRQNKVVLCLCLAAVAAIVVAGACSFAKQPAQKTDPPNSPEAAYRAFMLANLQGTEAAIRPLIVEQPGMESLWKGPYPPDVAKLLAEQYRSMEIRRVAEAPDKVTLESSAGRSPLDVVFDGKKWKLDPEPIIRFRESMPKSD